jgi:hypothetical protein
MSAASRPPLPPRLEHILQAEYPRYSAAERLHSFPPGFGRV